MEEMDAESVWQRFHQWLAGDRLTRVAMEKDAHFGDGPLVPQAPSFFSCAPFASCHIPLSLNDPIVQWPRTLPFHGSNTGSNPVRVANCQLTSSDK